MDAKHQFKYTYKEGCEDFSPVDITFDIPGDVTLSQMLYNFQSYLKAVGFVFDGTLEIVDDTFDAIDDMDKDETIYPADSDGWCDGEDCGWDSTSSSLEERRERFLKEWNEGIAKLDNEQKQKCREEALKMSDSHYEATKEVKKNNWVHGICNPPSPDWKKKKA